MVNKIGLIVAIAAVVGIGTAAAKGRFFGMQTGQVAGQEGRAQNLSIGQTEVMEGTKSLVVAGGCFWCVEAIYEDLKGVVKVESGYTGGDVPNPKYAEVCTGTTGHAEAVKVTYDPKAISDEDLLRIFLTTHDPTTLNRQGSDYGTQYRSAVFVSSDEERSTAKKIIDEVNAEKIWPNPIVTTIEPLGVFFTAEDYHQDYFKKFESATEAQRSEMNFGYCRAVIEPKVAKFRAKYRDKLKK